jgi:hypothetical protein
MTVSFIAPPARRTDRPALRSSAPVPSGSSFDTLPLASVIVVSVLDRQVEPETTDPDA